MADISEYLPPEQKPDPEANQRAWERMARERREASNPPWWRSENHDRPEPGNLGHVPEHW